MSRRTAPAALLLTAACLAGAAALPGQAGATAAPAVAGPLVKAIVAFDAPTDRADLLGLERLGVVSGVQLRSIDAVAVTAPMAVLQAARALPGVTAVVPQRKITLDLYRSKEQIRANGVAEPDTYTSGGAQRTRDGVTGEGVTVGIIDSGIFAPHPGFGDRVVGGYNFELSSLADAGLLTTAQLDTYSESTGELALQDEVGHGTHVAGTVGGDGGGTQTDRDLSGVAPDVSLVSLKIASAVNGVVEDIGFEENALAAIDYVIRHPDLGIRLTNNSWGLLDAEPGTIPGGMPTDFDAANAMVEKASAAGVTMVFSAGNDGPEPGSINKDPGGTPSAITVAAACKGNAPGQGGSCPAGQITGFSSRGAADGTGPQVDVSAPGDQILAPVSPSVLAPLTECADPAEPLYYCISGTSMAAPHVAGVVALMQQVNPELLPAQAERCLTTTAADLLAVGRDIHSGFGMVDTVEALRCANNLRAAAVVPPTTPVPPAAPPAPVKQPSAGPLPATGATPLLPLAGLVVLGAAALVRRRLS
ncbi:MAG: S8 family serine peptidase [Mycobacteriales bacterium]|nr:S8 family serine peptidase [Mycobacteriales bacterium]